VNTSLQPPVDHNQHRKKQEGFGVKAAKPLLQCTVMIHRIYTPTGRIAKAYHDVGYSVIP